MQTILFYLYGVYVLTHYDRYLYSYVYENHVHVDDGVSLVGKFSSLIYTSSIPLLNNDTDYFTKK